MPVQIDNHHGLLRPNYVDRQRLTADDLMSAQRYLVARQRQHNRYLHGWGVTCGLDINPANLPVATVQIFYRYDGGNVNLSVNGDMRNVSNFEALDGTTIGGVAVTIGSAGPGVARIGTLQLAGEITSLAIGGQELMLFQVRIRETAAGPETPYAFDGLPPQISYAVGDVIPVEGLPLNVQPFTWSNGTVFSGGQAGVSGFFSSFGTRVIGLNNVNLSFSFTQSCTVEIGAGYFVTPNGDEVHVPERVIYDLSALIEACVPGETPCSDPSDLSIGTAANPAEGVPVELRLLFMDGGGNNNLEINGDFRNLDTLAALDGETVGGVMVTHEVIDDATALLTLSGAINAFAVGGQELAVYNICLSYTDGSAPCITFDELNPGQQFSVGSTLETSGYSMNMRTYQWSTGEYYDGGFVSVTESGVFVNNINLALTFTVGTDVYLVARYHEVDTCPSPAVPGECQPISDVFFARVCETYAFDVICDLPPLHQPGEDCDATDALFCETNSVPCPPDPGAVGDYVVLARIIVDRARPWDSSVIDTSIRRRLLSDEHVNAMLRCLCQSPRQIGTITDVMVNNAAGVVVRGTSQPVTTTVAIHGAELGGARWVRVEGEAMFMVGSPSHIGNTMIVQMRVLPTTIPNYVANLGFSVYFDDGRLPLHSASFGVFLPVRVQSSSPGGGISLPGEIVDVEPPVIVIDSAVRDPVENVDLIGAVRAERLAAEGITTSFDLIARPPDEIARITGMTEHEARIAIRSAIDRTGRLSGTG